LVAGHRRPALDSWQEPLTGLPLTRIGPPLRVVNVADKPATSGNEYAAVANLIAPDIIGDWGDPVRRHITSTMSEETDEEGEVDVLCSYCNGEARWERTCSYCDHEESPGYCECEKPQKPVRLHTEVTTCASACITCACVSTRECSKQRRRAFREYSASTQRLHSRCTPPQALPGHCMFSRSECDDAKHLRFASTVTLVLT
jgi:hypothetical protein